MLLTHAHTDHTGFAEHARATTGARVWIHEQDVQMARTGKVGPRDGSAAILLEDRGILFTGDVLCTHNAYTGRAGPQIMPSGLNADTAQALASLANLDGIKADVLLPGHGEPWTEGVEEAIRQARAAGPS